VADPKQLRLLGYAPLQSHASDVALAESVALVSTSNGLEAFSLEDPAHPRWRAAISTPRGPRRVVYSPPYFYVAMWEAGVGIYSAESLGLQEHEAPVLWHLRLMVTPNPARHRCSVSLDPTNTGKVRLRDASGRVVTSVNMRVDAGRQLQLDLSKLPAGVYFVEVKADRRIGSVKVLKQ